MSRGSMASGSQDDATNAADDEDEKWKDVPEWKRKILRAKAAKEAEKMAPLLAKQKEEAEREVRGRGRQSACVWGVPVPVLLCQFR